MFRRTAYARFLFLLIILFFGVCEAAYADPPYHVQGNGSEIMIEIDPRRNLLVVLVDNLPYKRYRIAMGKLETPTPIGEFKVINKYKNWGGGFGTRWIGLSVPWGTYGIHGTNKPHSIGLDASHGCVRMLNRQVEELFELVEIGTKVTILGHVLGDLGQNPRLLARGDAGGDVLLLQNRLLAAGYFQGTCNGKFGEATDRALRAFEKASGLPVDGVAGFREYVLLGLWE